MPRISLLRTSATVAVIGALLLASLAGFGQAGPSQSIKVKWGDTLWGLSHRYRVDMTQLAAANHMRVSDVLLAGRTLRIPPRAGAAGATTAANQPSAAAAAAAAGSVASAQQLERTFCSTYSPPTGPRGRLPRGLAADPSRLALRPLFAKWARTYKVPADLMEAEAWQESGWQNSALSPDGAVGIGQLLPATATFVNQALGTNLQLSVPSDNIRMMAAFLGYLLRATGGRVCDAVASYYQGFAALQRYGVLPVSQTYVRDVLSLRPRFGG